MRSFLSKIFSYFPSGKLKDRIRLFLYHSQSNTDFYIRKQDNVWTANYKGFNIKFSNSIVPFHVLKSNFIFLHHFPKEPIDILLDAGAFIGTFSLYTANKCKDIKKVIALEPDPKTLNVLKKNFDINSISCEYELLPIGLWDKVETLTFYSDSKLTSSIYEIEGESEKVQINTSTIDELLKNEKNQRIFIKMNIEGAELKALTACEHTIKNNKVHFAIAADHLIESDLTYKRVEAICKDLGLSISTFKQGKYITVYASNEQVYDSPVTD